MIFLSFVVGFFLGSPPLVCVLITKNMTAEYPELYRGALGVQFLFQGIGFFAGGPITGNCFLFLLLLCLTMLIF